MPRVIADENQFQHIFLNLTVNAVQSMPDGGQLAFVCQTYSHTRMIEILVQDTGCGISNENIKKIFEPLFTTKARGIGLGLTITKNLVDANKGKIEVSSCEHMGTTFKVTLPADYSSIEYNHKNEKQEKFVQ
jgi:signal transduction histidine kinase